MTKTFTTIAALRMLKPGAIGMTPLDAMAGGSFVWVFEFGSLGFGWDLVIGAWNFHNFR